MAALGITLIVTGLALVGGGVILWPRASPTEPSEPDDAAELRAIIDALEEEDKRIGDGPHERRTASVLPPNRYPTQPLMIRNSAMIAAWFVVMLYRLHMCWIRREATQRVNRRVPIAK
jgi:hypothetical protein